MAPKKRDKESDTSKNPRIDHIQADHELFLQAFESMYYLPEKIKFVTQRFSTYFLFRAHTNLQVFTHEEYVFGK